MAMLLFSEMCFMLVCFLVCHPRSKWRYLFAILTGIAAVMLAVGRFVNPACLDRAGVLAYFTTVAMTGALILLKSKKIEEA